MGRRLAAAVVATFGLLGVLGVLPVAAQGDDVTTTTTTEESTASTAPSTAGGDGTSSADTAEEGAASAAAALESTTSTVIAKRGDRGGAVRDLQTKLAAAGFSPGVIDGIFGRLTQGALTSFQTAVGLSPTGVYDSAAAEKLAAYKPPATGNTGSSSSIMSTREAQQRLTDAGFDPGPVDGLYGRRTRAGLEAFQRHVGIAVTGRVDAATSEALRNHQPGSTTPPPTTDPTNGGAVTSLRDAQRALANGPFDPGPVDGVYGTKTKNAIWALEKLAGITMNGQWGADDAAALKRVLNGSVGGPSTRHSRRWVEVDLSQQLMKVYDPGRTVPVLVSHISSGSRVPWRQGRYSGRAITPVGSFTIFRRISGWHQSSLGLGNMYNPLYITSSGIALHGSGSVPSYPASHGCIRVPMHIAGYLPGMLPNGTPVVVMQ
ncbi:MAG: peptidoglycan-binding protein [Acidimicrobiia bacterium]|nr:peptidoglycan-binding protein [Acidimicrobiia bacterium]MDH5519560.1 peptidoglycan-binding protein [Acidimicrobiia bacterium]